MAIVETSLGLNSGLREAQVVLHLTEDADWIDTFSSAPALGFVERATFANKFFPQPRSIAIQIVNTVGGGTRTFQIRVHGKRRDRAQSETLTVSGGASATFNTLGTKVFDDIERYEVLDNTNFTTGDVWNVGFQNADGARYGLPIDVKSKADILGAMTGTGVTTIGTPVNLDNATVDVVDQSISFTPALADSGLLILTMRTSRR